MMNGPSVAPAQCSKLRVHHAPCVHILAAGCMGFSIRAPGGCMAFPNYEYLGAWFFLPVHPVCAKKKSLILNTAADCKRRR